MEKSLSSKAERFAHLDTDTFLFAFECSNKDFYLIEIFFNAPIQHA